MSSYTQANRPLRITTSLDDPDALLLVGVRGREAVSELYRFELDLLSEPDTVIPFQQLVGGTASVMVSGPGGVGRHIHGILSHLTLADMDGDDFLHYHAMLVPRLWLWTRRIRSRIFQQKSVPEILRVVLKGLDVAYELDGEYPPRDYCVQYQESDFAFASRLMEEEGIAYSFRHSPDGHQLVLMDDAVRFPELPEPASIVYDPRAERPRNLPRVERFARTQSVGPGPYTIRDYHCELPGHLLEASQKPPAPLKLGRSEHTLGGGEELEVFDYPSRHARHATGVAPNGSDQPDGLGKVFQEGERVARLRMEAAVRECLTVRGASSAANFVPGCTFRMERHPDGDVPYLLLAIEHDVRTGGNYRSGENLAVEYQNHFEGQPAALAYRPPRRTPRPVITGPQTAVVTGSPGHDEPFLDRYGRVKVQFHWDREGRNDTRSSCWLRVAQVWAGKGWGAFFWPRPGHEVVVAFEDGDPDRPLVVGSVYNDANRPPCSLPDEKARCGIKSCSLAGDPLTQFNHIVFHDETDAEHLEIHSHTQEMITSQAMKVSNTPGPSISLSGNFGFPVGGSGGGGGPGEAEEFNVGSGSGGGLIGDLVAFTGAGMAGTEAAKWVSKYFPGQASFVLGNNLGVTMAGNRYTHILAGYDGRSVIDLESLVESLFPPSTHLLLGAAMPVLSGLRGDVALAVGAKVTSVYGGPKVDVTRAPKYALERSLASPLSPKTWARDKYAPYDIAACSLAAFLGLCTIGGDVAALCFSGYFGDPTQKVSPQAWSTVAPTAIISRLHALLNALEAAMVVAIPLYRLATEALAAAQLAFDQATAAVQVATNELAQVSRRRGAGARRIANIKLAKARRALTVATEDLDKATKEANRLKRFVVPG